MSAIQKEVPSQTEVVAKALINVKQEFELSNEILGNIIGVDSSTVSRIIKRTDMSHKKAFEASILLIRIYRSLFAILGGNQEAMKHWLNTENTHLGGKPIQRLQEWIGLSDTVHYLDTMRGKT